MAKIVLDIDDNKLTIVLNILENLKVGLIKNISNESQIKQKPVSSSIGNESNKRYLSRDKYKEKLNQKILEDDFLVKSSSTGRYLSAEDFKNKLKKGK